MNERPTYYHDVETCVEETLSKVGRRVALGTPLGLGKANHLVNEFFRRAREDTRIDLHIYTALTLARPRAKSELERRFLEPLGERLFDGYRELERRGKKIAVLGQVNTNLPFMYGDAAVAPPYFDGIVDAPKYSFPLFGAPNEPVSTPEYLIALHVSALIRDGGTLQIGIGALEDAVTYLLKLRHQQNALYREILADAGLLARFGALSERLGGLDPFEQGLYASSEMLVDGFLELYRSGILRRKVYQHPGLQRLLNDGQVSEEVTPAMLEMLVEAEVISARLTPQDFTLLQEVGILRPELDYEAGDIRLDD